ncbi:septum formation initiator family protein [bacterium]|nr:septum formation initiator family protein [bacterium]
MKRKLKFLLSLTAITGALFYVVFLSEDSLFHLLELKHSEKALEQEIVTLTRETNRLINDIQNIRNDNFFVEKVAREELGLIKDGEVIILFQ